MKVCFICSEYPPGAHGGIGTMTQVLGRGLARQGHEVRVVGVYPNWYGGAETEEDQGVQVLRLREREHPMGWVFSRYLLHRKVQKWVRAGQVDVVEVPDYQGWAAGWKRLPVPVVTRLHGSLTYFASELHRPIDRTAYFLERASLRRADYACSVCQYTARMTEQAFKIPLSSSAILYNPVESLPRAREFPRLRNRVVFSGTLTAKKGIVSLIKAWPIVVQSTPEAELHVFGKDGRSDDGHSMKEFLLSVLPSEARSSVRFHGHVSRAELFDAYQTSGLAVFPSYAEAFAVAPLESMACGCPTIFSQRGSGPELLAHEREGLLVDPDKPEEIAKAILRVLGNPSFARAIGEAGRDRVRDVFSIDRLLAQNVAFYERCTREFQRKPSLN
ncbi:MAG TPA: glycosyltransferase family 4 protein [Candidatus Acidoferrales bacterium]|nr:glycosyltransferase family 4 protein [Candidatus Acidoferrales bacterium]